MRISPPFPTVTLPYLGKKLEMSVAALSALPKSLKVTRSRAFIVILPAFACPIVLEDMLRDYLQKDCQYLFEYLLLYQHLN